MFYPSFIKKGSTIGVCAPSAGVGHKLDIYEEALEVLKNEGYQIVETKSVRKNKKRSASYKTRQKEFYELVNNKDVDMIIFATGGDYMFEMLDNINFDFFKNNPKWLMGYSDPTNLLYTITTNFDIATLYGFNACSYSLKSNKWQENNLKFIKGDIVKQNSFKKTQDFILNCKGLEVFDKEVKWLAKNDLSISGRLIGGCFDVIDKLIGTKYDNTLNFIEKYKDDGIVWYFDVFAYSSYNFYLTLLQMKYCGYFKYCKGVLFGRVAFENIEDSKLDYHKAADLVLKDIPHIMEMDIGHSDPKMTLINGAIINCVYKDHKGSISFKLK